MHCSAEAALTLATHRIAASARVLPSFGGLAGFLTGLGAIGTAALAIDATGSALSFLNVPSLVDTVKHWSAGQGDDYVVRYDRVGGDSAAVAARFSLTLGRTLLVPGLLEEVFWRVALFPHPAVDAAPRIPSTIGTYGQSRVLAVNLAFALYHPLIWQFIASVGRSIFHKQWVVAERFAEVFRSPSFLFLAFVLGNACSLVYGMSGCALYAPVFVHGVAVAVWVDCCGGEEALRGSACMRKSLPRAGGQND
mmetsp:Transcript_49967/g.150274  ORF Transcript_49967/g.150274 Transcript_49967/m.150274 type:complete len:251 (-) Transcript_49967:357-1109(-)